VEDVPESMGLRRRISSEELRSSRLAFNSESALSFVFVSLRVEAFESNTWRWSARSDFGRLHACDNASSVSQSASQGGPTSRT
jgi:hypothetical protein